MPFGVVVLMSREHNMSDVIGRRALCALVLACAVGMGIGPLPVAAQSVESSGLEFPSDESYLRLLAPGNEAYRTLDGDRMKRLVAEQTAIARRYRDAGHQYWGRIIGTKRITKRRRGWLSNCVRRGRMCGWSIWTYHRSGCRAPGRYP